MYKMSSMRSEESSSVTSPDHAPSTRFAPICKRDALRVPCTQQLAAMNAAATSEMALPGEGKVVGNPRRE